jgi:arylsulfatase A-like enzyme
MSPPNFLFILVDDLGWRDIGCYGSTFYETPQVDSLAASGVTFTNAYAACPVCSPTRASIMTGKYPATLGLTHYIGGNDRGKLLSAPFIHYLPLEERTIALTLHDAGYRTYLVGKWHLGSKEYWPEHHGFDVNVGGCEWGNPKYGYFSPYGNPRLADGPEGEYLTDRLTDEAVKLLQENGDAPFFMYYSAYAVHIPIEVPEEFAAKYVDKAVRLGLDQQNPFEEGEYFPTVQKMHQRVIRRRFQSDPLYAGMIENLDANIGRLMAALESLGVLENTVVIFTSDNGGLSTAESSPTCNAPLIEGKGWMYEGGTRVPLIVRGSCVAHPGSRCDVPVTSPDFYPTLLEMAGLPLMPEQHCDGESFLPLLTGQGVLERQAIYWHFPHYGNQGGTPGSSVRAGDFKLIEFFEDGRLELYNLAEDIEEQHNLVEVETSRTAELHAMLQKWRKKVDAKIPEPNPDWPHYFFEHFLRLTATICLDPDGTLCLRMRISDQNPTVYEVPLSEIIEFYLDKPLRVFIGSEVYNGTLVADKPGDLLLLSEDNPDGTPLKQYLNEGLEQLASVKGWKLEPEEKDPNFEADYAVHIWIAEDPCI